MSDVAIRVEGLSKRYRIGERQRYRSLRESLTAAVSAPFRRRNRRDQETIWALKDVSFEVKRGEVVGVIGRNGAGKSTLLKILSRITEPTSGRAEVHGRVGSLLEVGTGFHNELTGRENIYLNGAILGMKRAEIARKFDEIVAFAEVERFIDTPVKHYSSGMYLRLAFAVAAHLEPEILLVDEVLAVGDAQFQKKCLGKMGEVSQQGRTVLFVSHNMAAARRLCDSALWIDCGRLREAGATDTVVNHYLESAGSAPALWLAREPAAVGAKAALLRVAVTDVSGLVVDTISSEAKFFIEIDYQLAVRVEDVRVGYRLLTQEGVVVLSSADTDPVGWGETRGPGLFRSRNEFPGNLLNAGRYLLTVACDVPMRDLLFFEEAAVGFCVQLTDGEGGAVPGGRLGALRPQFDWTVDQLGDSLTVHAASAECGRGR